MTLLREQVQRTLGSAYTVERELDGGGMSRVLVATESALGRRVVIKVLAPELAAGVSVERFRREILLAAGLQHPHIVPVLSTGELDGLPYFIMPFVEGESLRTRLVRGRLSVPESVRILRDVARALAYAHERGIVHRDIKPDNVLLSSGSAAVADFGVAKALLSALGSRLPMAESREPRAEGGEPRAHAPIRLTTVGTALGTPAYMAPEQAAADPAIDHRADLYAMGVMAYEMLSGATPFTGDTPRALLAAQLTEPPRPLAVHRPDIPVALQSLVMRLLEKEPAHRPQTAAEVVAALDDPNVVSGAFASGAGDSVLGTRHSRVRTRWASVLVAALVTLVGAGTWWGVHESRRGDGTPSAKSPVPSPQAQSLAVLPLVNIGPDSGDAYLAAGLTDEVTTEMGKVRGIKVASRTAALAARTDGATVSEIASRLGVSMLLEGTVQRAGKRVRVTARLLSASDGFTVWSDVYESESGDVLRVQDDIAQAIARALGEELVARDSTATRSPTLADAAPAATDGGAAHEHYLRGRFLAQQSGDSALPAAIAAYRAALGADSAYAPAHAGLAEAYVDLALSGRVREDSAAAIALAAGERAVALAPSSAESYVARGRAAAALWRWDDAERDLRQAVARADRDATAHRRLGELLVVRARAEDGARELARAVALDSASMDIGASLAVALARAGRTDEAVSRARALVARDPASVRARVALGQAELEARQLGDAVRELEMASSLAGDAPDAPAIRGWLAYAYAQMGDRAKARALAAPLERGAGALAPAALARAGLADTAAAMRLLERGAAAHEPFFVVTPLSARALAPLRGDPRFAALVRILGAEPARPATR